MLNPCLSPLLGGQSGALSFKLRWASCCRARKRTRAGSCIGLARQGTRIQSLWASAKRTDPRALRAHTRRCYVCKRRPRSAEVVCWFSSLILRHRSSWCSQSTPPRGPRGRQQHGTRDAPHPIAPLAAEDESRLAVLDLINAFVHRVNCDREPMRHASHIPLGLASSPAIW